MVECNRMPGGRGARLKRAEGQELGQGKGRVSVCVWRREGGWQWLGGSEGRIRAFWLCAHQLNLRKRTGCPDQCRPSVGAAALLEAAVHAAGSRVASSALLAEGGALGALGTVGVAALLVGSQGGAASAALVVAVAAAGAGRGVAIALGAPGDGALQRGTQERGWGDGSGLLVREWLGGQVGGLRCVEE